MATRALHAVVTVVIGLTLYGVCLIALSPATFKAAQEAAFGAPAAGAIIALLLARLGWRIKGRRQWLVKAFDYNQRGGPLAWPLAWTFRFLIPTVAVMFSFTVDLQKDGAAAFINSHPIPIALDALATNYTAWLLVIPVVLMRNFVRYSLIEREPEPTSGAYGEARWATILEIAADSENFALAADCALKERRLRGRVLGKRVPLPTDKKIWEVSSKEDRKTHKQFIKDLDGLGFDPMVFYGGNTSRLTFGRPGSGKTSCVLIPEAVRWYGSLICIDPKGEIASVTARGRATTDRVFVLDPMGEVKGDAAKSLRGSFNPLSGLADADREEIAEVARTVADALVIPSGGDSGHYWDDEGRTLIELLVLHCLHDEPTERHTLMTVREYLNHPDGLASYLERMINETDCEQAARLAADFLAKPEKEQGYTQSSAARNLRWVTQPKMSEVLQSSDLDIGALKETPTTVFLVMPPKEIRNNPRWLRLLVNVAMARLMRGGPGKRPVLLQADEFPALGRMREAEKIVAEGRSYGVTLHAVVQNLPQMKSKDLYGDDWENFQSSAGVMQVLGVNDLTTAKMVSDRLGTQTVRTQNVQSGGEMGGQGETGRPLMTPDEVITQLGNGRQIAFMAEGRGILLQNIFYRQSCPPELLDDNPHGG